VLTLHSLVSAREQPNVGSVVLTNGCFDLLHVGHVRSLEHAASLGDLLIVGINDDPSVLALKGAGRPLMAANERAELIAALGCVDLVTIFPELTAEALVSAVKPDVYVKGGDYDEADIPEAVIVRGYGGRVVLSPVVPGRSTSSMVDRIRCQS
jgi:rfaE bifunctional protein nucleotidyltransferase chain/domain